MKMAISRYHDSVVYGGSSSQEIEYRSNCDLVRSVNAAIGAALRQSESKSGELVAETEAQTEAQLTSV